MPQITVAQPLPACEMTRPSLCVRVSRASRSISLILLCGKLRIFFFMSFVTALLNVCVLWDECRVLLFQCFEYKGVWLLSSQWDFSSILLKKDFRSLAKLSLLKHGGLKQKLRLMFTNLNVSSDNLLLLKFINSSIRVIFVFASMMKFFCKSLKAYITFSIKDAVSTSKFLRWGLVPFLWKAEGVLCRLSNSG